MSSLLHLKTSEFYPKYKWYFFVLVFCSAFGVFSNTLNHSFALDDTIVITKNKHVLKGIEGIPDILTHSYTNGYDDTNRNTYRPVSLVAFALEKHFLGLNSYYFHLFNVINYALLCVLIAILCTQIFREEAIILVALMLTLFIVHPIHTEVVANIKSRDEIYSMLFGVASLILFLKHTDTQKISFLVGSLLCYALSLFSKENTITLMAIFPLIIYYFRDYTLMQALRRSSFYLIPVLLLFAARFILLDDFIQSNTSAAQWEFPFNNTLFAASNYVQELATNFVIFFKYLQLSAFPVNMSSDYSIASFDIVNFSDPFAILGVSSLIVLIYFAAIGFRQKSIISFAILFFLSCFSITSNFFFKIGCTLGERFLFLPSFGVAILIAFLLWQITRIKTYGTPLFSISALIILVFYVTKTVDRNADWYDSYTLQSKDILLYPNNGRLQQGLAFHYHGLLDNEKSEAVNKENARLAINYYQETLELHPNKDFIEYSIANVYSFINDYESAVTHYLMALPSTNVAEHEIFYNIGLCYENLYKNKDAISYFKKAIAIDGTQDMYWRHLAYVYYTGKQYTEAIDAFQKAIRLNKGSIDLDLQNIAISYHAMGDYANATEYYNRLLKLDPKNATALRNLRSINQSK